MPRRSSSRPARADCSDHLGSGIASSRGRADRGTVARSPARGSIRSRARRSCRAGSSSCWRRPSPRPAGTTAHGGDASTCRVDHARSGCSSSPRRVASLKTSARPLVWSRSWRIVISRLTWRTSGRNRRTESSRLSRALVDELEDRGRHERLRDAADDHRAAGRQQSAARRARRRCCRPRPPGRRERRRTSRRRCRRRCGPRRERPGTGARRSRSRLAAIGSGVSATRLAGTAEGPARRGCDPSTIGEAGRLGLRRGGIQDSGRLVGPRRGLLSARARG